MAPLLLATKLYFPPSRANLVPRPRLVERLSTGLRGPLTLVSAPAGYGKTSLLGEWRVSPAGYSYPIAWLSLDPEDNEIGRFLAYLIAAIATIKPGFGQITLASLQSPQPPPPSSILTNLINELAEIEAHFALVLDDYQVISTQPIHDTMAFLLDHLPPQMHLVILSRADPPLPLARLRARNQMIEIRAIDLRFTLDEARMFLKEVMSLPLTAEEIDALERRTEGWIAGLQLAALSLHGREDPAQFIATFGGGSYYIVDYLVEEVLDRQPEPLRMFLLQTSILDRLSGPLCEAVTGQTGGQATLEQLERSNLFVTPIGGECCRYRYHHLFADVMQNRLRQKYPDMVPELHHRASRWFEQNQFIGDSIHHAAMAGNQERVASLIEQNAMAMLMAGELATLLNWIKPVEFLTRERPWLCIYHCWALILTGQRDRVAARLQDAEHLAALQTMEDESENMQGHIAAIRAYSTAQSGEAQLAIEQAQLALRVLPESNQAVRSVVMLILGTAQRLNGELRAASCALEEAVKLGKESGNIYLAHGALSGLADLWFDQGRLHRSYASYQELLRLTTSPDGRRLPAAGMALFGLSLIDYEWNDLDAALKHTRQAIDICQQWGHGGVLMVSQVMLSRIRQAHGDGTGARDALFEAERLMQIYPQAPRAPGWVEAFRVRSWLAQGDLESAASWAERRSLRVDDEVSYLREVEYLTLGRVLLSRGEPATALTGLACLQSSAEKAGRTGSLIEILLLSALAYLQGNHISQALATLSRGLALAEPEGFTRVFLDEGAPVAKLLRHAGSKGIAPETVSRLLQEFDRTAPVPQQPLIEPLSERELEVLRLIAAGKSNQEIAAQLVLSTGTVKSHLNHIFNKLSVDSRTQCLARARQLKLLS